MFQAWNRNKRSLAVDLKTEAGREIIYKLVEGADVAIENYRAGIAERLGIDYDTLKHYNPQLIYCSATAFGDKGPYRDRPAYDQILQAISGAAAKNEEFGGNVAICSVAIADYGTALLVFGSVNAALYHRAQTGEGQRIETSLLQGAMAMQSHYFVDWLGPDEEGNAGIFPNQIFPTKEGLIQISAPTDKFWRILCETIGADGLAIMAYYDQSSDSLKVAHCGTIICSSFTTTIVDNSGASGRWPAIAIGRDGNPIIFFEDRFKTALRMTRCNDAACTTSISKIVVADGVVGRKNGVAIRADGSPIVLYENLDDEQVMVLSCANALCQPYGR